MPDVAGCDANVSVMEGPNGDENVGNGGPPGPGLAHDRAALRPFGGNGGRWGRRALGEARGTYALLQNYLSSPFASSPLFRPHTRRATVRRSPFFSTAVFQCRFSSKQTQALQNQRLPTARA